MKSTVRNANTRNITWCSVGSETEEERPFFGRSTSTVGFGWGAPGLDTVIQFTDAFTQEARVMTYRETEVLS